MDDFFWGCLGAIIPELVRLRSLYAQPAKLPGFYFVLTLLFVVASGLVAVALPGDLDALTAVYAGAAAPIIVSKGLDHFGGESGRSGGSPDNDRNISQPVDQTDVIEDPNVVEYLQLRPGDIVRTDGIWRFLKTL